jgi:hypothetical protein
LACDNSECQQGFLITQDATHDTEAVRASAAERGWIRLDQRFDLCPTCAPGWTPDV